MKHPVIRIAAVYFLLTILPQTLNAQPFHYPAARKVDQKDTYFGTTIDDPYRWLEDDRSEETAAWVTEENKVTEAYLSSIPFREEVRSTGQRPAFPPPSPAFDLPFTTQRTFP